MESALSDNLKPRAEYVHERRQNYGTVRVQVNDKAA
jgi:hypothetical protein